MENMLCYRTDLPTHILKAREARVQYLQLSAGHSTNPRELSLEFVLKNFTEYEVVTTKMCVKL